MNDNTLTIEQMRMDRLRAILSKLAAEPHKQIQYLEELGVAPSADELGLEFDDVANTIQFLSSKAKLALGSLDDKLSEMSGKEHEELWTTQALLNTKEWREVRQLAQAALAVLDET